MSIEDLINENPKRNNDDLAFIKINGFGLKSGAEKI